MQINNHSISFFLFAWRKFNISCFEFHAQWFLWSVALFLYLNWLSNSCESACCELDFTIWVCNRNFSRLILEHRLLTRRHFYLHYLFLGGWDTTKVFAEPFVNLLTITEMASSHAFSSYWRWRLQCDFLSFNARCSALANDVQLFGLQKDLEFSRNLP